MSSAQLSQAEIKPYLAKVNFADTQPILLVGPSGIGKTRNMHLAVKTGRFGIAISSTERPRRTEEIDGIDYHFYRSGDLLKELKLGNLVNLTYIKGYAYGYKAIDLQNIVNSGKTPIIITYFRAIDSLLEVFPEAQIRIMMPDKWKKVEKLLVTRMNKRIEQLKLEFSKDDTKLNEAQADFEKRIVDTKYQITQTFLPDGQINLNGEVGRYIFSHPKQAKFYKIHSDLDGNKMLLDLLKEKGVCMSLEELTLLESNL